MNLPFHQAVLYAWSCPLCTLNIRTRLYDKTYNEAKWHCWTKHRVQPTIAPGPCLWDVRIKGTDVLYTFDEPAGR